MCNHASKQIQMKSHNVKDAVFEMIDLLCSDVQNTNTDDDLRMEHSLNGPDFG